MLLPVNCSMATLAVTASCRGCRLLSNAAFTRCLASPVTFSPPSNKLHCRYYAKKHSGELKPPGKVKVKAVGTAVRYLDFISTRFEQRFPKLYQVYKILKNGVAGFYEDAKIYLRVVRELYNGKGMDELKRFEVENFRQFPRELWRVGPTVVMLNIPILDFCVPPLLYFFPRQLLSRHFWTPEQKLDFGLYYLKARLERYPEVLDYLERHTRDVKDDHQRQNFQTILKKMNSGEQPSVEDILRSQPLFERKPFGLDHLAKFHRIEFSAVAKCIGYPTFSKQKLERSVLLIYCADKAMLREGLDSLSMEDLQQTCFTRGLNAVGLSRADLEDYMKKWLAISKNSDGGKNLSLLIHSPVLLGYTMPSNRKWIITKRDS